jgi:MFS family permease
VKISLNPRNVFYGWWVVLASAVGVFWGVPVSVYTFSVFAKPFMDDFHAGRAAVSGAFTLQSLAAALCAPLVGRLVDRYGARRVILPSIVVLAVILIFNKLLTDNIQHLYLFYAALGLQLNGVGPIPYGKVISQWFDRRRGLALGLTMLGIGAGAMILPPFAQALIARFNWHIALVVIGVASLLASAPVVATLLKEKPEDLGLRPDGIKLMTSDIIPAAPASGMSTPDACRDRKFWLILCSFFLIGAAVQGCVVHMAPIIVDRGAPARTAALGSSLIGAAVLIARVGTGYLLDRLFAPMVACLLFGCAGLGIALLLLTKSISFAFLAAFLIGIGLGAEVDIVTFLIGRYFGLRSFGKLFSFALSVFLLAGALGPLAMGAGFDRTGAYRAPLAVLLGAILVATIIMIGLGPYRYAAPGVECVLAGSSNRASCPS